jgi:SH3-like domain-containing protein
MMRIEQPHRPQTKNQPHKPKERPIIMHKRQRRLLIIVLAVLALTLFAQSVFAERMAITVDTANVRSGPGTEYADVWKVEKYHPIEVFEKKEGWYHFKDYENDTAWVHGSLAGKISTVIIRKGMKSCNVRSGPGTSHDILFKVDSGVPFKILKRQGDWLQVEHADGDQGWLHNSLVW